jgi:hypothetical protein
MTGDTGTAVGMANTAIIIALLKLLQDKGVLSSDDVRTIIDVPLLTLEEAGPALAGSEQVHAILSQFYEIIASRLPPSTP